MDLVREIGHKFRPSNPHLIRPTKRSKPLEQPYDRTSVAESAFERAENQAPGVVVSRDVRAIERVSPDLWGGIAAARTKALFETTVTPENETMLRSFHPALEHIDSVSVFEEPGAGPIWSVPAARLAGSLATHVGGRELHCFPALIPTPCDPWVGVCHDRFRRVINCRRILIEEDVCLIRQQFPYAVGVRVLVSGIIVVLFKDMASVKKSWDEHGIAATVGFRITGYAIARHESTSRPIPFGHSVARSKDYAGRDVVCLGLKLRYRSGKHAGKEMITTVTHGFVDVPRIRSSLRLRLTDWSLRVLRLFKPDPSPLAGSSSTKLSRNSPIGEGVWLAGSTMKIGTIIGTYDPPIPRHLPFPFGYRHDLSLIEDSNLPILTNQPNVPFVDGWASHKEVLDGAPVFLTTMNVQTGDWRVVKGHRMSQNAQKALIVGSEYLWDKESRMETCALLWRTKEDTDTVAGASGSVLCMGNSTDKTAKAIVFQNYQSPLRADDVVEDQRKVLSGEPASFKAGFLLPREVLEAEIVMERFEDFPEQYYSLHPPPRTSADQRRVFTGQW